MRKEIGLTFVQENIRRIITKTGRCYLVEGDEIQLAVRVIERGQFYWQPYARMERAPLTQQLLRTVIQGYDENDVLLIERVNKKGRLRQTKALLTEK